ncbi:MAG: hypothetical protein QOH67_3871, partial [Hyphomicrobiales bacterium]|nr:hypothetical protein [Hyphomicrobiales bacterium]
MFSATVGAWKEPVAAAAALAISLFLGLSGTAGADDRRQILRQIPGPDHNIIVIGFDHIRGQAFRAVIDPK